MLNHLKNNERERLQAVLAAQPAFNVRVSALLKAYGAGQSFFNVWHQDFDTVLARLESSFFICAGENADFEEIAFFLRFNPYFNRVIGKSEAIEKIAAFFAGGYERRSFDFLALQEKATVTGEQPAIDALPSLSDVYNVMDSAKSDEFTVGDFVPWYTDISHRIRHGCARAFLLKSGGLAASACLVSAESQSAGLISGVATCPEFRGHGFAIAVLRRACSDLAQGGKLPVLECLPSLTKYYSNQGFYKLGEVEELNIINAQPR